MRTDLLKGRPVKSIILFALPIMASALLQFLYNMIDNVIVGRYVGTGALAAVGSVGPINSLLVGTAMGLTSGFTIPVARSFGENNQKKINKYIGNSLALSLLVSIVLVVIAHLISSPILRLLNTPSDIINMSSSYVTIIYFGIPFSMIFNNLTGISRAIGDSKTPLIFLTVSSFTNLFFDLLFVKQFGWGVNGAAFATVIAQCFAMTLLAVYMRYKTKVLKVSKSDYKLDIKMAISLIKIGVPLSLQFTITAIGSMCLQGAVNSFGSSVVAAFTAANKVENIANIPLSGLGVSLCTFISQNLGAKNYQKIRVNFRKILILDLIISVFCTAFLLLLGEWGVSLFMTEYNAEIMDAARQYLHSIAICFSALSVLFIFRNSLQGLGFTYSNAIAGAAELLGRIFVAYALVKWIGFNAICFAGPFAWLFADIPLVLIYISKSKWLKGLAKEQELNKTKE